MPIHQEIRHSNHSPEELFSLVADIAKYPEFLPWCSAARVREQGDGYLIADLVISFAAFREKYTSKVCLYPPEPQGKNPGRIEVELVEGPFSHLTNSWKFEYDAPPSSFRKPVFPESKIPSENRAIRNLGPHLQIPGSKTPHRILKDSDSSNSRDDVGGERQSGCTITFGLDFKFRSKLLEKMIGVVFEKALKKMVSAFEERADELFGER